jgi:beta-lactam-binding protein with PASTA domain
VGLTVCDAPAMETVRNVLDFDDGSARAAITGAGLSVGAVTMTPNCTLAAGEVLTQNPSGGAQVAPGTAVNLTESTGKQANGKPCIVN